MFKNYIFILAIVLFITNCTDTGKVKINPKPINSIEYKCKNGQEININYFSVDKVQMVLQGNKYDLKRVHSASGEKYSNGKQTWWSKGSSGFFQLDDVVTIKNCTAKIKKHYINEKIR